MKRKILCYIIIITIIYTSPSHFRPFSRIIIIILLLSPSLRKRANKLTHYTHKERERELKYTNACTRGKHCNILHTTTTLLLLQRWQKRFIHTHIHYIHIGHARNCIINNTKHNSINNNTHTHLMMIEHFE